MRYSLSSFDILFVNLFFNQSIEIPSKKLVERPDKICKHKCGIQYETCAHTCTARCHAGPHPPCPFPIPFNCSKCGQESKTNCGWPSFLVFCDHCSHGNENGEEEKLFKKKLQLKFGRFQKEQKTGKVSYAPIQRESSKHSKISSQVINFFDLKSLEKSQVEIIQVRRVKNKALKDSW